MSGRDWYAEADLNLDGSASNEWSIYDSNDDGDDRRTIATVYGSAAPARLIVAAPDLFEALNSLAGSVGGLEIAEEAIRAAIGNTNWSVLQTHLDAARAALSKAEGGSDG